MIRIATYNIRKCVGLDWRRRPDRVIRVLAEISPDVVALQEADRRLGRRSATLHSEALFGRTALRIARLDDPGHSSGWHGNAILVRDGIRVHRIHPVNLPSLEPRGALIADLEIEGAPLRVVGVHLGLRPSDRRRQAHALLRELQRSDAGIPTVVLGDLNEWTPEGPAIAELSAAFTPSPPVPSFHTTAPFAALDRILIGPGLRFEVATAHRSVSARRASDHLPVWADIVREPIASPRRVRRPEEEGARSTT